jgi:hypothetical protein
MDGRARSAQGLHHFVEHRVGHLRRRGRPREGRGDPLQARDLILALAHALLGELRGLAARALGEEVALVLLGAELVGQVARQLGEAAQLAAGPPQRRDLRVRPEARAVLALAERGHFAAAARGRLGEQRARLSGGAVLGREEDLVVAPEDLVFAPAVDARGAGVPGGDAAFLVEQEERVIAHSVDQQAEALLAGAQRLLGEVELGAVAHLHDEDVAGAAAHRGEAPLDQQLAPVAQPPRQIDLHHLGRGHQGRRVGLAQAPGEEHESRLSRQLRRRVAEERGRGRIGVQKDPARVEGHQRDGRRVEDLAQLFGPPLHQREDAAQGLVPSGRRRRIDGRGGCGRIRAGQSQTLLCGVVCPVWPPGPVFWPDRVGFQTPAQENGAPNRTRTCGLRFRKPTLYPPELWGRTGPW